MVIAVAVVRVVQVIADAVVDVVAVGHALVAAVGTMNMIALVRHAGVRRGAEARVVAAHGEGVLVGVVAVDEVEMSVVEVVGVILVADTDVAAIGAVGVVVIGVRLTGHRDTSRLSLSSRHRDQPRKRPDQSLINMATVTRSSLFTRSGAKPATNEPAGP